MFLEVDPGHGSRCSTRASASRSGTRCRTSTRTRSTPRSTRTPAPTSSCWSRAQARACAGAARTCGGPAGLEPLHRDLARVTRATARRARPQAAGPRLQPAHGRAGREGEELRRLVSASGSVFAALAERGHDSRRRWPSCRARCADRRTLWRFAASRRCCARACRLCARRSAGSTRPTPRSARSCARPSPSWRPDPPVHARRPPVPTTWVAAGTPRALPDLTTSLDQVNRFFNMGAFNPGGAEGLAGLSIPQQRAAPGGLPLLARLDPPRTACRCSPAPTARVPGAG